MIVKLKEARYVGAYRVWLLFESGESGEADLGDWVWRYRAAEPLRDEKEFARFFLDEWPTLAWPCGFDVAPEALYERVTGQSPWSTAAEEAERCETRMG
jgi:hypothetical protein